MIHMSNLVEIEQQTKKLFAVEKSEKQCLLYHFLMKMFIFLISEPTIRISNTKSTCIPNFIKIGSEMKKNC